MDGEETKAEERVMKKLENISVITVAYIICFSW